MVCHTDRHRGIYGVRNGYLSHGLQFKTGLKRLGKKREVAIKSEYIDKALSDFFFRTFSAILLLTNYTMAH